MDRWLAALALAIAPVWLEADTEKSNSEAEADDQEKVLEPITVHAQRVANLQPASSFATLATELRFRPGVDLQARGLPEGQADITVRGGLFENTGFRLGAITIFDPQTGHYAVEIPLDTAMLSSPDVLLDVDNGLNGFNASVATVSYGFRPISSGGSLAVGIGTDSLAYGSIRAGQTRELDNGRNLAAIRGSQLQTFQRPGADIFRIQ